MNQEKYDIIIIGGGPSGLNCAIAAQTAGLSYLVLEKGVLVNSIYNFPANMTFFSTSLKLEIGNIPFISHTDKPTRKEALEYYRRITESYKINIHYREKVESVHGSKGHFTVASNKSTYEASYVVATTGYYDSPKMMDVPGENLPKVKHYYDEAHPYIGQDIIVVGGANSACDVALETWQKGARVTMVIQGKELYQKVKYWILPNIENRIKEGSIKAYFQSNISEIKQESVTISTPQGPVTLKNDYVLAMTGYTPNYDFLEKIGLTFENDEFRTPVFNADTLESSIPGLYVAGVINGGLKTSMLFIENTREHGGTIVQAILSNK